MVMAVWSLKGGSGTTTVATALAVLAARELGGALLVDLAGDAPSLVCSDSAVAPGVAEWLRLADAADDCWGVWMGRVVEIDGLAVAPRGRGPMPAGTAARRLAWVLASDPRAVVIDCGTLGIDDLDQDVTSAAHVLARHAAASVLVTRGCALSMRRLARSPVPVSAVVVTGAPVVGAAEVAGVAGAPVLAEVPYDLSVAQAVHAGRIAAALPDVLADALAPAVRLMQACRGTVPAPLPAGRWGRRGG
jgi:hypothetical protein